MVGTEQRLYQVVLVQLVEGFDPLVVTGEEIEEEVTFGGKGRLFLLQISFTKHVLRLRPSVLHL